MNRKINNYCDVNYYFCVAAVNIAYKNVCHGTENMGCVFLNRRYCDFFSS